MSSVARQSPSWFAVDGNTSHCAHTQLPLNKKLNSFRIELEKQTHVQAVEIFSGMEELSKFSVHVTDSSFWQNAPSCGTTHTLGKKKSVTINCDWDGKYVYVVNHEHSDLNLCEVRVWTGAKPKQKAKPGPPPPPPKPQPFGSRRRSP